MYMGIGKFNPIWLDGMPVHIRVGGSRNTASHFMIQRLKISGIILTLLCCKFDGYLINFRLTLLWYHAVIRPFVALDEGSNEEGTSMICIDLSKDYS